MGAQAELTFEDWLEHAFGHEVRYQRLPWFFDEDCAWWDAEPATAISFLTRLFQAPDILTAQFSDDQIAQGLTYLLDTGAVGDNGWFYSREVPAAARKTCIAATFNLFSRIFQQRCLPVLGHRSKVQSTPLNNVAYMFWDVFPCVALPDDPSGPELQLETVAVMGRILSLDSIACVESALHGLGHAHATHALQVEQIIDRFVAGGKEWGPELAAYAQAARCGCVL
jgi:hypothetical protein